MHVSEIYYEKVFPIAPYVNEKVGVKISVSVGESENEAIEYAKMLVNDWGYKKMEEERPPDFFPVEEHVYHDESEPRRRQGVKIKPDAAVRSSYAKAKEARNEKMIQLLENMYDFDAAQK